MLIPLASKLLGSVLKRGTGKSKVGVAVAGMGAIGGVIVFVLYGKGFDEYVQWGILGLLALFGTYRFAIKLIKLITKHKQRRT